jgi:hypothetical protein
VELFLLPFYEAMSLPSGDDHCVGLHRSTAKLHGMMECWVDPLSIIPIFQFR